MHPSFEELGVGGALVEALAAEGIEVPTPLQALAYPVLKRGNPAVLRCSPGGGGLVAYLVPLLERIEAEGTEPHAIVLARDRGRVEALALSAARIAAATGHRVGALGAAWALPERSALLFATPEDLARGIETSEVKVEAVTTLVLDGATELLRDRDRIASVLAAASPGELQIVVVSDPVTPEVRRFVEDHARRAVFLPPEAGVPETAAAESPIQRGTLRVRTAASEWDDTVPRAVADLLEEGYAHVLVFARSEDRAADLGDELSLRGFLAGPPGDPAAPVWLGVDPIEAREALRAFSTGSAGGSGRVAVLSADTPTDPDELDRRHGGGNDAGVVLPQPRELPHLRAVARAAGYTLAHWPIESAAPDPAAAFRAEVERVLDEEDLLPYLVVLEPLFRTRGPEEVAAALASLVRRGPRAPSGADGPAPAEAPGADREVPGTRPPAWVRLFVSLGERDGVGPGDVLGAILGESGVARDQVGRIDLRDTFSRVEVHEGVADRIIRALNGTTIRGRSVRADFDRQETRTPRKGGPEGPAGSRGSGPRGPRAGGSRSGEKGGRGPNKGPGPGGGRGPKRGPRG